MTLFDMFDLDGRVAIVTGTSSGLGVSLARTLASAGAAVVLAARRSERIEELAADLTEAGHRAVAVATDIADEDDCPRARRRGGARVRTARHPGQQRRDRRDRAGAQAGRRRVPRDPRSQRRRDALDVAGVGRRHDRGRRDRQHLQRARPERRGQPAGGLRASKAAILALTRDLAQEWSDASSYFTGQTIVVDGEFVIT